MITWSLVARRVRVPMGFLFACIFLVHLFFVPPAKWSLLASLALVVPGALLRAYASGYLHKNAQLATTGPYAFTRNPLYFGSMLMAFGFTLAARSWLLAALLALLFAIIYVPTIVSEEGYLRGAFADYDAYMQRVPRFFPRLTPARSVSAGEGTFSWAQYRKHREYNAALGAVAIYAALLARILMGNRL